MTPLFPEPSTHLVQWTNIVHGLLLIRETRPLQSFTPINSSIPKKRSSTYESEEKKPTNLASGASEVAAYLGIGESKTIQQSLAKKRKTYKNKSTPKKMTRSKAKAKASEMEPMLLEMEGSESICQSSLIDLQQPLSSATEAFDTVDCDLLDFASELTEVDWVTISPPTTPPRRSASASPMPDAAQGPMKRIIRPFPEQIQAGSPIPGLSTEVVLRTSFCVGEALNVGCQAARQDRHVLLELYARVMSSWREDKSSQQHFVLADLTHDNPPFVNAVYAS